MFLDQGLIKLKSELAFLEFKVVPKEGRSKQSLPASSLGNISPPVDPQPDRGYILVYLNQQDVPVPEYASEGATQVEKLRRLAPSPSVRIIPYSEAF